MADHPLRSATHRCLGRPLPHQLANGTRTHLYAIACKQRPPFLTKFIMSVFGISSRFQLLSTCYSPVRHFTRDRSPFRVRLACVKHAASVQSEPESNSPVQICSKDLRWTEIRISKFLPVRYSLVNEPHRFTRREAVVYAASFSLSTSFFHFAKVFFSRPRRGNSLARGRLMSHFQTRVKNFFAIRENFFSRRPFGRGQLVGANGFMRLFDPTVKHFSAKNFPHL